MLPEHQIRLALLVAEHGIRAHEAEVARFADDLRREGIDSPLIDLCSDTGQPEVARERAFGRLQAVLARWFAGDHAHDRHEHDRHEHDDRQHDDRQHDCPAAA